MNPNVLVKINALDNTKDAFRSLQSSMEKVGHSTSTFSEKLSALQPTFQKMAAGGAAALTALVGSLSLTAQEARNAEAAQFRLRHILETATGASEDQINALHAQADALEQVGVVSGEAITQAQAQLATFDLQAETIQKLTPAILDYVVAEKGANATTEDLKQLTNGLAQALNGNFGSLTRVGFVLDDVTKEMISNGTEAERAAALVTVLNSTYEGMNVAARGTAEGGLVALKNETGRLAETLGQQVLPVINRFNEAVLPVITRVIEWMQANPQLTQTIIAMTAALAAVVTVLGTIGLVLPAVISGVSMLAAAFTLLTWPVALIIAAIAAFGFAAYTLWDNWELVTSWITTAIKAISDAFWTTVNFIIGAVATLFDTIFPGWQGGLALLLEVWSQIWTTAKNVFSEVWEAIKTTFAVAAEGIQSTMEALIKPIQRVIDLAKRALELGGQAVSGVRDRISSSVQSILDRGSEITGRASGGPVVGRTPYIVGEAGPELFVPNSSGTIIPNGALAGVGAGYGQPIYLTITGNTFMGEQDMVEQIGDKLIRIIKNNGRL